MTPTDDLRARLLELTSKVRGLDLYNGSTSSVLLQDELDRLCDEAEAALSAPAKVGGEAVAWEVRVYFNREDKWSRWQRIDKDAFDKANATGHYYEYDTIETRALVPADTRPAADAALPAGGGKVVARVQRGPAPHDPLYAMLLPGVTDIPEGTPLCVYTPPPDAAVGAQGDGLDVEALRGMFRALVDAGGPSTVSRHGVERGADKWENDVRAGMFAIERLLHPERFDEFPAGRSAAPAAGKGVDALAEAVRGLRFDVYALTTPELRTAFDGKKSIAVVDPGTVAALKAALTRQPVAGDGTVPDEVVRQQESLYNPATQVFFRAGLIACREYMARFVQVESPSIAASIRANWWPQLGPDLGPPRQIEWGELTDGEFGTDTFSVKPANEVSPTLEALPIALHFLGNNAAATTGNEPRHCRWSQEDEHGDFFDVGCGHSYIINDAETAGMKFCTYCGDPIEFAMWKPEDETAAPAATPTDGGEGSNA